MASASFIEVVSHFAGYLQIFNDIARDRIEYDQSLAPGSTDDYTTERPVYDVDVTPDDMETKGSPVPSLTPEDVFDYQRFHPIRALHDTQDLDPDLNRQLPAPNILLPMSSGGGGGSVEFQIRVHYQPGSEQSEIQVQQHNTLYDDDTVLQSSSVPATLTLQLSADTTATIERMAEDANNQIPKEWWIPQNDAGATDFLTTHDANWAANGGTMDAHSVQPGYYLNGVLQDPAPTPPDQTPLQPPAALPDTGHDIGQWATLGNNSSINAALIVDLSESGRTMIVNGDYFSTNAVFQTNTTIDHDHVAVSGGTETAPVTGQDVATNIADFVQHPGIYTDVPATYAGPNWSVDVVSGNYYNVHTLAQTNYLFDNDVVTQTSSDSHYNLVGGDNQLGNLAEIHNGNVHYDLIVVEGSYHGMNVIYQNNMLLNDDRIYMATDGTDASQSVNSGQNSLQNEATIENYGGDNFTLMTDGMRAVMAALENKSDNLDPSLGNAVPGSGGTFHVLYITGDYYDVNAVWQTNVTSDVNVIYQLQGQPSDGALAYHANGVETQSVTTGQNSLVNDAAIIDVGPTNTHVNGQVYTDSILVQANLLPTHQDQAVTADTGALVPELIAFVHDSQDEHSNTADPTPVNNSVQTDPIASVLH